MTPALLARLFIVPALIVSAMICLAVVVVLFGGVSVGQRPPISDLVATIESASGSHSFSVAFMPRDREVWQAAQELATRLQRRDQELHPDEIEPLAKRIEQILAGLKATDDKDDSVPTKRRFLLLALARLGTDSAVDALVANLADASPETRQTAVRGLMEMHAVSAARAGVDKLFRLIDDESSAVRLVACLAIGLLAEPHDAAAIAALRGALASSDRELRWNAATALARLGDSGGKAELLAMLDRGYWEQTRVTYADDAGRHIDRPFEPAEVSNYLVVAIDAAARLPDAELHRGIERLVQDRSAQVSAAARAALSPRKPGSTAPAAPGA